MYRIVDVNGTIKKFTTLEEGWQLVKTNDGPLSRKPRSLAELGDGLAYCEAWVEEDGPYATAKLLTTEEALNLNSEALGTYCDKYRATETGSSLPNEAIFELTQFVLTEDGNLASLEEGGKLFWADSNWYYRGG